MDKALDFSGKVVLVTGGGKGVGETECKCCRRRRLAGGGADQTCCNEQRRMVDGVDGVDGDGKVPDDGCTRRRLTEYDLRKERRLVGGPVGDELCTEKCKAAAKVDDSDWFIPMIPVISVAVVFFLAIGIAMRKLREYRTQSEWQG